MSRQRRAFNTFFSSQSFIGVEKSITRSFNFAVHDFYFLTSPDKFKEAFKRKLRPHFTVHFKVREKGQIGSIKLKKLLSEMTGGVIQSNCKRPRGFWRVQSSGAQIGICHLETAVGA
ncbi:hypothetical protein OUZ56_031650 [Daphnia magna]|uniref:Uncharacterized protein n=1 Tax=Daphnia magna TaxID=35525 RepID=A0ABQ9ZUU3_9CRUS|nr:hypothetical protein OUZ56_031650 [Daphnia magna]